MKISEYLENFSYPGRFITAGFDSDGNLLYGYAIMGRSTNSRNRVFRMKDSTLYTEPYDPSLVEDPSLIIYPAIIKVGEKTIIANGDQSVNVEKALLNGQGFADGLVERTYEPDAPNFTPRITALVDGDKISFSILRRGKEGETERVIWTYPKENGIMHAIHTYEGDGNPLPSFAKDPVRLESEENFADVLWNALDQDNKISLYVKSRKCETIFNARESE